jgi:hypothetical protein
MKKVCQSLSSLSDEGVPCARRHALETHDNKGPRPYGGQTGIRLRVTTPRVVQRNKGKSRPGIPEKGAWHGTLKVSLIPQSSLLQLPKWLDLEVAIQKKQIRRSKPSRKRFFPNFAGAILSREKRGLLNSGNSAARSAEDRRETRVPGDHRTAHNEFRCESFRGCGP